jgi:hypothetical protein
MIESCENYVVISSDTLNKFLLFYSIDIQLVYNIGYNTNSVIFKNYIN